ncbi:hypothetical protein IEQ34_011822 [Dendrobium chrysotoxum]|uniref:Uncharacterized protein n=1 Tax=Dendrobium chrysotoxum TaxID=161865 RepID=A0AAV7GTE5_DENCH|nr:hypothetical protein IEQ34_011822 [Dendrobium chrysotoxum]
MSKDWRRKEERKRRRILSRHSQLVCRALRAAFPLVFCVSSALLFDGGFRSERREDSVNCYLPPATCRGMEWWRRMVKRARVSVAAKEKARKEDAGDGILKLHGDIQTCEYQDILVMWDMLQNTNTEDKAAVNVTSSQH